MKDNERKEIGKKLQNLVYKSTGQNEDTNEDGGYTVGKEILPNILSPNFLEDTIYSDCIHINISEGKNGIKIPITNESTRSVTNIKGGFRSYVIGEGVEKTPSQGSFSQLDLSLNKQAVVVYITDELLQDAEALAGYINKSAEESIVACTGYSVIHGNSFMNGIDNSPATAFVSCTDPITVGELHDFFDKYYGGKNGKWYLSKVRFGQILDLYETAAGGSIMLTASNGTYYLFGYPIVVVSTMLDNEMLLGDLSQYVIVQKNITMAVNESIKFLEDEKAFRFVFRANGGSIWPGPITLADASVVHPFVMCLTQDQSSSSSSSGNSESSESSNSSGSSTSSENQYWSSSSSESSSSDNYSGSSESSSSSSKDSNSSSSSEGNSSSSSSSSSSTLDAYCGDFVTVAYDGTYIFNGEISSGSRVYSNGTVKMWLDPVSNYWAMSGDVGDPQNQWVSSKDTVGGTPDGTWVGEAGTVTVGSCA